jgi:NADP-dependent 3-hydroxy acid dehydrogenase YdfG
MNQPAARITLVTGAGSGVGLAVAQALLADGFTVVFAGRRAEPLEQAVAAAPTA